MQSYLPGFHTFNLVQIDILNLLYQVGIFVPAPNLHLNPGEIKTISTGIQAAIWDEQNNCSNSSVKAASR